MLCRRWALTAHVLGGAALGHAAARARAVAAGALILNAAPAAVAAAAVAWRAARSWAHADALQHHRLGYLRQRGTLRPLLYYILLSLASLKVTTKQLTSNAGKVATRRQEVYEALACRRAWAAFR